MSIPPVLMTTATNESQDIQIQTEVLEPNSSSRNQTVFVLPKKGSVLDSNSVLKVGVSWESFDAAVGTDVSGKWLSGLLPLVRNARLYCSGALMSDLREAGHKIHIDKMFEHQEKREEICDVYSGGNSAFVNANSSSNSGASGSIQNVDAGLRDEARPYYRALGKHSDNNQYELFLKLHELFPMLKDLQLPLRFMRDEVRVEIDWETNWDKIAFARGAAVAAGDKVITLNDPVLFLDYITYNPMVDSALEESIMTHGVSIPFRQTVLITNNLGVLGDNDVGNSQDTLLGQEGRSVMKIYVVKKYANTINGVQNTTEEYQGNCRSESLLDQEWNCVVNDLLVFDRNVSNNHEAYAYLSFAGEKPFTAYPETYEYNANYGATSTTDDVLFSTADNGTDSQPELGRLSTLGLFDFKDGFKGSQNYIGIDLSKYGKNSPDNPLAGMRIGATPIIFRLQRSSGADHRTKSAVALEFYVEYLRLFDLRGGETTIRDL